MERHKKMFQWPQFRKDIIWRRKCDVKFKVMNPTPSVKFKIMFKPDSSYWVKISDIYIWSNGHFMMNELFSLMDNCFRFLTFK